MGNFAVSSGHHLTTQAAAEVLRAGGTAVDAAIAGAFMACIAEPVLASPLAGGFLMVAQPDGRAQLLDAFVQTPKVKRAVTETDLRSVEVDFGETCQTFHCGAGTIATPGLIPGIFAAHDRFGRIPMPELVAQAAAVARAGATITPFQAEVLGYVAPIFQSTPAARALYGKDDGMLRAGDVLKNPDMADVFEVMALEGPRFTTEGEVAQAVLSLDGSHLTTQDLQAYRPIWREPLALTRGGVAVALNPSPGLGGVQIALVLQALPPAADDTLLARCLFEVAQIRKDRDLDHHPALGADILLEPALIDDLRRTLRGHQAATRGTTHISVVDAHGTGAAFTLSNGEGCGCIVPGTGIMANNMLGEDDLVPDGPNSWHTDSRLASMMCPMALRDDDGLTMLGSGGSNRIRSALAQVALGLIDRRKTLEQAIAAPRLHVEPDTAQVLDFEDTGTAARRDALLRAFPQANAWPRQTMFFGGVHAAGHTARGGFGAAGDPRRSGVVLTE